MTSCRRISYDSEANGVRYRMVRIGDLPVAAFKKGMVGRRDRPDSDDVKEAIDVGTGWFHNIAESDEVFSDDVPEGELL